MRLKSTSLQGCKPSGIEAHHLHWTQPTALSVVRLPQKLQEVRPTKRQELSPPRYGPKSRQVRKLSPPHKGSRPAKDGNSVSILLALSSADQGPKLRLSGDQGRYVLQRLERPSAWERSIRLMGLSSAPKGLRTLFRWGPGLQFLQSLKRPTA